MKYAIQYSESTLLRYNYTIHNIQSTYLETHNPGEGLGNAKEKRF